MNFNERSSKALSAYRLTDKDKTVLDRRFFGKPLFDDDTKQRLRHLRAQVWSGLVSEDPNDEPTDEDFAGL